MAEEFFSRDRMVAQHLLDSLEEIDRSITNYARLSCPELGPTRIAL